MTSVAKCPKCNGKMEVKKVTPNKYGELVRYRKCVNCGYRFVTSEIIDHEAEKDE